MALEFPASPSVGDIYSRFTWDGEAWSLTPTDSDCSDLDERVTALEVLTSDITNLTGPTGADGEPSDYNVLVIDKSDGQVKAIPEPNYIEPE